LVGELLDVLGESRHAPPRQRVGAAESRPVDDHVANVESADRRIEGRAAPSGRPDRTVEI
jgi:hypothetical protein